MSRPDNRQIHELRPIEIQRPFTRTAAGSVFIRAGGTAILCTASIDDGVPPWKKNDDNPTGWVTAEYCMLPGSTSPRKRREREKIDSRSTEIQRLIGRSLRAVVDFAVLGPRTLTVDCDVIEADGGTRTLSITGGFLALVDALRSIRSELPADRPVLTDTVAAVSVGIVDGEVRLDLEYIEDSRADVDLNVVLTGRGEFIEVQGTAEGRPFSRQKLDEQLTLATSGIVELTAIQRDILGTEWPLDSI